MIDPIVRSAAVGDGDRLAELEQESRAALIDRRGGRRWLRDHPAVGDAWEARAGAGDVFVATIDDVVVGYACLELDDEVARVLQVYVTPHARELGFGDALLAAVIESARERGAGVLDGEALPGDRDTKNLYERAGIKARLITVSTEL